MHCRMHWSGIAPHLDVHRPSCCMACLSTHQSTGVLQAHHRRVQAALEKEQVAHRNARLRISKAEERAAMERTARR